MYWNHRLVCNKHEEPCAISIVEVFYDKDHTPWSYSTANAYAEGSGEDAVDSIRTQLRHMHTATEAPILIYPDDFKGKPVLQGLPMPIYRITSCRTIEEFNWAIAMKAQMICPISGAHNPADKAHWETKAKTRQIHMANAIVDAYLELKGGHPELAQEILGRMIDTEV